MLKDRGEIVFPQYCFAHTLHESINGLTQIARKQTQKTGANSLNRNSLGVDSKISLYNTNSNPSKT